MHVVQDAEEHHMGHSGFWLGARGTGMSYTFVTHLLHLCKADCYTFVKPSVTPV